MIFKQGKCSWRHWDRMDLAKSNEGSNAIPWSAMFSSLAVLLTDLAQGPEKLLAQWTLVLPLL
eukprot:11821217-Ditylum_brightwellii.AAC.1